jgi:hypothetical protein
MSMSFRVTAFPIILTALLSACAGGGGGGAGGDRGSVAGVIPEVAFTSFSAAGRNQTVVMSGMSQSGSGTIEAFGLDAIDETASTAKLTYDGNRNVSGFSLATPRASMSFGPGQIIENVDSLSHKRSAYKAENATHLASVVDPAFHEWNYQSFGVWFRFPDTTLDAGATSFGAASPVSALPMSTGTFTGHASGFYFDGQGNISSTDAHMRAIANFGTQSIDFSTDGTRINGINGEPKPELNLSGTLNYAEGGINQFSGNVTTQGAGLSGNASGKFYGPNAEEIGGVYGLTGSGGQRMLGGFGGKR